MKEIDLDEMAIAVENCNLQIGDRVKVFDVYNRLSCFGIGNGFEGTVVVLKNGNNSIGVELDYKIPDGNNCDGHAKYKHGWYFHPICLEKIERVDSNMRKFKVGDIVKITSSNGWNAMIDFVGENAVVLGVNDDGTYAIKFDENFGGHSCNELCEYGYGWNLEEEAMELATKEESVQIEESETVLSKTKQKKKQQHTLIWEYPDYSIDVLTKEDGRVVDKTTITKEREQVRIITNESNGTVVVILGDGTKGIARCLPEDEFDVEKGTDIAHVKAIIKLFQKKLKQLTK